MSPSVYGATLAVFSHYANARRFDEAIEMCRPLALDEKAGPYARMKAAEVAAQLLSNLGRKEEATQWGTIANHLKMLHMDFDLKGMLPEGFARVCGIPIN